LWAGVVLCYFTISFLQLLIEERLPRRCISLAATVPA
jgi:hypothetical protein